MRTQATAIDKSSAAEYISDWKTDEVNGRRDHACIPYYGISAHTEHADNAALESKLGRLVWADSMLMLFERYVVGR